MPGYVNEADLSADVIRFVDEKFGPFKTSLDVEQILPSLIADLDTRNVLSAPKLSEDLAALASSDKDSSAIAAAFAEINRKTPGLRMIFLAAGSEDQAEFVKELGTAALLNDQERERLEQIVKLYSNVLSKAGDHVVQPEVSEEAMLESLSPELVERYIGRLYESAAWLRPEEALVAMDKLKQITESKEPNALLPQTWMQFLFDEDYYVAVIDRFEKIQRPLLADAARLLLYQARVVRTAGTDPFWIARDSKEMISTLDRLENYTAAEFGTLGDLGGMILLVYGMLRFLLGMMPDIPAEARIPQLLKADEAFEESDIALFRAWSPMACWMRAQLLDGNERTEVEMEALAKVNRLYAETAIEKEPIQRLSAMTMLASLPAQWKFAKGDFAGAIESATTGKSLAQMLFKVMRNEMAPLDEELAKAATDGSLDAAEQEQLANLKRSLVSIMENSRASEFTMDLLILSSKAKMAEGVSNFAEAYRLYHEAAAQERKIIQSLRGLILTFLDAQSVGSKFLSEGFQHDARAEYFQGLADLNRGDQKLMESDFSAATESYEKAKLGFSMSADLWSREFERLGDSAPDPRNKAQQERGQCLDRVRYCDARIEMAKGERASGLDQHWQAAKQFEKASGIFAELVEAASGGQENRALALFKASQDVCSARYLMESQRKASRFDAESLNEIMDLLNSASLRFAQNNERQWETYTRALRCEYEAAVYWKFAPADRNAQARASEAALLFRQIGMEKRARDIEYRGRAVADRASYPFSAIVLPKPLDISTLSQNPASNILPQLSAGGASSSANWDREADARKLVARSIALDRRLSALQERRDRGRVDEGQYTDLAGDLDRERIETVLDLQHMLRGRDPDIDSILRAAAQSEGPELRERLGQLAVDKGLPKSTVDEIRRGEGSIVSWIVELSFPRVANAAA